MFIEFVWWSCVEFVDFLLKEVIIICGNCECFELINKDIFSFIYNDIYYI